eukprot:4011093-Pleurochrysis_carterae.AAC.5
MRVYFQHSPVRVAGGRALSCDLHDDIAHGKNTRGGEGLVKKSGRLSALMTNGTVVSWASTRSRTKKWRRSMCFDRWWCSGF